ncbi:spore germination protein [Brevibacillus sp. B_LB10_24]|uniref:spore germination protein n=1 Tax=Brevibacillus sp. B_LB10_24 TaxID=3380645 RepID=UPI0038BB5B90
MFLLPSIVGAVNINSNSGSVNFGDALNVSQKSYSKSYNGAGAGNIGNLINANSGASMTNTADTHLNDQVQVANA